MIEILFDHSTADNYFVLSKITVDVKDQSEKERIGRKIIENGLEGSQVFPDNDLRKQIAKLLEVDENLIDFDTNEIDL